MKKNISNPISYLVAAVAFLLALNLEAEAWMTVLRWFQYKSWGKSMIFRFSTLARRGIGAQLYTDLFASGTACEQSCCMWSTTSAEPWTFSVRSSHPTGHQKEIRKMHNGAIAGLLANSPLCPQPKQKAGGCKTNRSTSHSIRSDNSPSTKPTPRPNPTWQQKESSLSSTPNSSASLCMIAGA